MKEVKTFRLSPAANMSLKKMADAEFRTQTAVLEKLILDGIPRAGMWMTVFLEGGPLWAVFQELVQKSFGGSYTQATLSAIELLIEKHGGKIIKKEKSF